VYVEQAGPVEGERAATSPELEYSRADRNFRSERPFNAFGIWARTAFPSTDTAINQADVPEQEKNEAKTLLRRLLGSKTAVSVLGPGAQSLAAKYFTE
jgi:hypothetical protein